MLVPVWASAPAAAIVVAVVSAKFRTSECRVLGAFWLGVEGDGRSWGLSLAHERVVTGY